MKSEIEIQRAHDLLIPPLTGEIDVRLSAHDRIYFTIAATVLCWVLQHEHNPKFKEDLEGLEQRIKESGYNLEFGGN